MIQLMVLATLGLSSMLSPIPDPGPVITEALPIRLYSYNPKLGGINCNGNCEYLGNGMKVSDQLYDKSAACPVSWGGYTLNIYDSEQVSPVVMLGCNDTGGAVRVAYEPAYGLVIRIDVLSEDMYDPGPYEEWSLDDWKGSPDWCSALTSWAIIARQEAKGTNFDFRRHVACTRGRIQPYADR